MESIKKIKYKTQIDLEKERETKEKEKENQELIDSRKSLYERNKTTKWIYNNIIKQMDEYVFARAITIFSIVSFFLGNNLNTFLWIFIGISIYTLTYRVIRFWMKRYLLYLTEFCYFEITLLIIYLLFDNENVKLFSICYICNTGLMSLAIILFNNQTQFNNTDHLISSWIHTLPLIVNWSIRWRHIIYFKDSLGNLKFNFPNFEKIKFEFDSNFYNLIIYPFAFWVFWAIFYYIMIDKVFKKFIEKKIYRNSLADFIYYFKNKKFWGNVNNNSIMKFLVQHLFFFLCGYPIGVFAFYNYYFNTVYIVFIIVYLGWNTVRNENKRKKKGLINHDDY